MVQRKVSNNKLGLYILPKTTLKTDTVSQHATLKPSLQSHDAKTKAPDLKAIKMKKSRSMKRPDVEIARRPLTKTRLTEPPAPAPTPPIKTPNYMKSTNCSELHKVEKTKTKTKTISSFNKVRTLTRAPTFKHSKTLGTKTHYFDAKRATCSSTLKDYKFPSYLKLTHGATEGKGTSVIKVCPYTYCSLNGHHHKTPAPPLKSFLLSRRKMLKTQKNVNFEVTSPRKVCGSEAGFVLEGRKDDFFVKIHVPRREPERDQVSEIDFECRNSESDSDSCVSSDRNLSDMEWVEGNTRGFEDEKDEVLAPKNGFEDEKVEVLVSKDCGGDEFEPGFELDGEVVRYVYDEIVDFMLFSDADTVSDSESTRTVGDYTSEQIVVEETICSADENDSSFLKPIEEVIEAHSEANNYESNEESYTLEETTEGGDATDNVMEETRSSDVLVEDKQWEASLMDGQSEVENTDDASLETVYKGKLVSAEGVANCVIKAVWAQNDIKELDSNEVELDPIENDIEEVEPLPAIKCEADEVHKRISNKENGSIDVLLDICSKLKKSVRRKQANEDSEEDRDFNPRAPNFLPVEPEPEAEKVDLRHQDMDERRNAEDWMLDHALQKTVNQLAPARRRKVALLVEAFETVLPIPTYEPHMRRNLSVFSHARTVQACR